MPTHSSPANPLTPRHNDPPCSLRLLLASIALLATLLSLALTPVSARAGTYVIENCPAAPAANSNAGAWTIFGSPQADQATCAGPTGAFIGPLGGSMAPNTNAGITISAPSPITIRQARVWWYVPAQISGATTFAVASTNAGVVGASTTPLDDTTTPQTFELSSTTTSFTLADYCSADDGPYGCTFGAGENPILKLLGAQLTLEDTSLPSGNATGGALASATRTLTGTQTLVYSVKDPSSGVRLVKLLIDGTQVAENDYLKRCPYEDFLACPANISDTISWNTPTIPDGTHTLEAIVQNAAQNTSIFYTATITTNNAPTNTTLPVPLASVPNGTPASETATLHLNGPAAITRSFNHRAFKITGELTNNQAQPIASATLDVLEQTQGASAPTIITHTTTRPTGAFTLNIPAGPSRIIEIAYRALSSDTNYAATAHTHETVHASAQLKITPHNTSPNGTIILSGRVEGPIPPQGTIVELLVHYHGHWEPFRDPRTNNHGYFHIAYQFQGATGRFPFQAQIPAGQTGYPYSNGHSNTVNIATA